MASSQLTSSSISTRNVALFQGPRPSGVQFQCSRNVRLGNLARRWFNGLVVKSATVVAPKYTAIKPLGDRVLVKVKEAEEKSEGGILLPSTAQTKPQGGEVVAVGEGKTLGKNEVEISVKPGAQIVYSKYAGTEEFRCHCYPFLENLISLIYDLAKEYMVKEIKIQVVLHMTES